MLLWKGKKELRNTFSKPLIEMQDTFSVASYNIHRGVGLDRRFNSERIARVILELKADVIGLQETDSAYHRRDGHKQLEFLSEATGLNVVMGPTRQRLDAHYGNALLTRWPVLDVRRIDLSVPGREPRGALDVDLDVSGKLVRVIVAHLGLGIFERRRQVRVLREIFCMDDRHLEVMLGDFNEWFPKGPPLCWVHDYFGKPPARRTFPSFMPFLALDRIWVRPLDALLGIGSHTTPLSRIASDHLPVKATISLLNGAGQESMSECM